MLFYETFKIHKKKNNIIAIFSQSMEIKKNATFKKVKIPIFIPKYRLAIEFNNYDKNLPKTRILEDAGITILNIPKEENEYFSIGRIINVILQMEKQFSKKINI